MNYFKGKNFLVQVPDTTARIGENYEIYLKIDTNYGFIDEAKVIINQEKGSNEKEIRMNYITTENKNNIFVCDIPLENVGLHYFCIKLIINQKTVYIKNDISNRCASITNEDMSYWTLTVYNKDFTTPKWAQGKIMYQIFPDRFYQSKNYEPNQLQGRVTKNWNEMPNWQQEDDGEIHNNDFFMGNLKGIEEKLDYLTNLGVGIIYLNPVFWAQSNHRYDTIDYEIVDPYLGTNESLKELCNSAHEHGMRVVIDAVLNHTGNDSKYFNEFNKYETIGAFTGLESPYYSWYKKNENGDFTYWWGFKNLPVCDGNNPEWQSFIYGENGIIDKWFSMGIDGLRIDVADELTDDFIENIRTAVKRNNPEGLIIGEVWENAITKEEQGRQRKYMLGCGLDTVMNYPFTNAILKYVRFGRFDYLTQTINEIITLYPKDAVFTLMNSLSTHDITRAMTTLVADGIQNNKYNWVWDVPYGREWQFKNEKLNDKQYEKAKELMKIATTIQYFLPGNPCIYYGDEIGMYGYKDPFNRKCFKWDEIDSELHEFFIKLGKIRNQNGFLSNAEIRIIDANENILVFERFLYDNYDDNNLNKRGILIIVNRSENEQKIILPKEYENAKTIFEINKSIGDMISKYGILIKKLRT